MVRLLPFLVLAFVAHSGVLAHAPAEIVWLCWLDARDGVYVHCRLDEDPLLSAVSGESELAVASDVPVGSGAIRQDLFASGRAPNVARLVRERPAQYAALMWSIPLHALPYDDSPLRELAQSVMCGSDAHCVAYIGGPQASAQRHAAIVRR